jgi:hypothetical protein
MTYLPKKKNQNPPIGLSIQRKIHLSKLAFKAPVLGIPIWGGGDLSKIQAALQIQSLGGLCSTRPKAAYELTSVQEQTTRRRY